MVIGIWYVVGKGVTRFIKVLRLVDAIDVFGVNSERFLGRFVYFKET